MNVAETAAQDKAAIFLDPLTNAVFRLDEVPNDFNQEPQYNQAILFMIVQMAFFQLENREQDCLIIPKQK